MKNTNLRYITISSKKIKKHLLITHKEVNILHSFIQNTTNSEVLILNTNLGIEIYYLSTIDCGVLVKNSFLLLTNKRKTSENDYRIFMYNSINDIKAEIQTSLLRISAMPLSFKCYSKNLFNQLKLIHINNEQIILELFKILEDVLASIYVNGLNNSKIEQFIDELALLPININHSSILKLGLTREAMNNNRRN